MNISDILSSIDSEIAQLRQARALLAGIGIGKSGGKSVASPSVKPKRTMSALARRKIAAAQRKRWAKARKAAKPTPAKPEKKSAPPAKKRRMSTAARRRIADAQKKRWAAIKAKKATSAKKGVKTVLAKKVAKKAPVKPLKSAVEALEIKAR